MGLSSWVISGKFSKATVYKGRARVRGGPTVLVVWGGQGAQHPRPGGTREGFVTTTGFVGVG